jgi:hypothetical protein
MEANRAVSSRSTSLACPTTTFETSRAMASVVAKTVSVVMSARAVLV